MATFVNLIPKICIPYLFIILKILTQVSVLLFPVCAYLPNALLFSAVPTGFELAERD
jgi:hypothetical protein